MMNMNRLLEKIHTYEWSSDSDSTFTICTLSNEYLPPTSVSSHILSFGNKIKTSKMVCYSDTQTKMLVSPSIVDLDQSCLFDGYTVIRKMIPRAKGNLTKHVIRSCSSFYRTDKPLHKYL